MTDSNETPSVLPTPVTPEISLELSPQVEITEAEALAAWLRDNHVEEVECVTPDFAGIGRGKVMPASKFARFAPVYLPTSIFFLTITGGYPEIENFRAYDTDADLVLRPDLGTTRSVPWASDRSVQVIHDVCDRRGRLIEFAPRSVLRRVLAHYDKQGWKPVVAPELEFYLTKPNTDPDSPLEPPVGRSGRVGATSQAYSIVATDEYDQVIEHIYDYAAAQGLEIDTIIQEAGAAQLEINLQHGDPLDLADQVFLFKRMIREAALRCGCYATFMAKPMAEQPGSAMHIHQSVVDAETGENIFSTPEGDPSDAFLHFVGGQQTFFRAAAPLVAPYVNSYRRLVPHLTAPINMDWGRDNRTTGLREPISRPDARRIENRVVGADANPYLAIAACLAAGYLGMMQKIPAREAVKSDSYDRPRELPYGLLEGLEEFSASEDLQEVLGKRFCRLYAAVKQQEHAEFMRVISSWEREHLLLNV
ncbi:MAG: glutamine synthetase family protein [Pseudomonadota bacterium]